MTTRIPTADELAHNLRQFTGTESYHRYLMGVVLTDGARYFAENAGGGAFWLMDILATQPEIRQQPFAHATLTVADDSTAKLTVTDGNDNQVYERTIDFTTCPAGKWEFYIIDGVILIPSEY